MNDTCFDEQLKAIHGTVGQWFDAFMNTPEFAGLSESEQRKAGPIVNYFTEYCYRYVGATPAQWDRGAVYECCTEALPRKVSAELSFFQAVAPVLSAFFRFLADRSFHPRGEELAEVVDAAAEDIVSSAKSPRNWGPAKQFVMSALAAGVDVSNSASLTAFAIQHNLEQAARADVAGASHKRQFAAEPYEPCPCGSGKKFKFCCRQGG